MSALECALKMKKEDILERIIAQNLPDYGLSKETLAQRIEKAKEECREEGREPGAVAALNNADVDGVLLEILKEEPEKVMEGIAVLAYVMESKKKLLFVPEYAAEILKEEQIRQAAEKYGVEMRAEFLDLHKQKGSAIVHIVTAFNLSSLLEESYEPAVYVSVNGGPLEKKLYGTKLSQFVNIEGAKAVQAGYRYLLPEELDIAVEEADIDNGILRVLTGSHCIVAETVQQLLTARKQSCGKCVFCREGLLQLHYMQKEITDGRGKAEFLELTKEIGEAMGYSTCCTLGQISAEAALSAIKILPDEYEAHMKKKKCPAGVCFSSEIMYIDPRTCTGCGDCMDVCPRDCIEGKAKYIHMIDDLECDKCGKCLEVCEAGAVVKTSDKPPKLPDRLTKVGRFKKR